MSYSQWPTLQGTADSNGNCTVTLQQLRPGQNWRIGMISVETNSTSTTTAAIRLNSSLVSTTSNGNGDTADGDPPVSIGPNDVMIVQWSGANQGDLCYATFFYEDANSSADRPKAPRATTSDPDWQWR